MLRRGSLLLTVVVAAYLGAVPVYACHGGDSARCGWKVAGEHAHGGCCRHEERSAEETVPLPEGSGAVADEIVPATSPSSLDCCTDVPLAAGAPSAPVTLDAPTTGLATVLDALAIPASSGRGPDPGALAPQPAPPGVRGVVLLR